MTDAHTIARSLSPAMRKMILEIGDGQPREYALGQSGFALLRLKLVFINELGARHLSDDGQSVRAIIEEEEL